MYYQPLSRVDISLCLNFKERRKNRKRFRPPAIMRVWKGKLALCAVPISRCLVPRTKKGYEDIPRDRREEIWPGGFFPLLSTQQFSFSRMTLCVNDEKQFRKLNASAKCSEHLGRWIFQDHDYAFVPFPLNLGPVLLTFVCSSLSLTRNTETG